MKFEKHEYIISKESCGECITISKKAFRIMKKHFNRNGRKVKLNVTRE